jgi:hypothetical protein
MLGLLDPWGWRHHDPSKWCETLTQWHSVTPQYTWIIRTIFHYLQTLYHFTVGTGSPFTMHFNSRGLPLSIINSEEFILVTMLIGTGAAIWITHCVTLFYVTKYYHMQMPYRTLCTKCMARRITSICQPAGCMLYLQTNEECSLHCTLQRRISECGTIFFHITSKMPRFRGKIIEQEYVFWFSLQLLSETFLILKRTEWDIIINVHRSSCKVPVILARF